MKKFSIIVIVVLSFFVLVSSVLVLAQDSEEAVGDVEEAVGDVEEAVSDVEDIVSYDEKEVKDAKLKDPTETAQVLVEEFECENCENEDLGRIVAENLRVVISKNEKYVISKEKAHISLTGVISQDLDGFRVKLSFFNYYVNQGGQSKVLVYKTEEEMIQGLDLMFTNLEKFRSALYELELKKIKANEERLRREQLAEEERLKKLKELEARRKLAYEKFSEITSNMVLVKGDTFEMGYNYLGKPEGPAHKVTLSDYYIDKYPVSNTDFVAYLNEIKKHEIDGKILIYIDYPSSRITLEEGVYVIKEGYEKHPVVNVTWYGANNFAEHNFKRLPTEAEWENAAKGKEKTSWPLGNTFNKDSYAYNTDDTVEVGSYPPNTYGIYDMAGNVYEWVNDWYDPTYYKYSPLENPKGPTSGEYKILRGGSWYDTDEDRLMTVFRYMSSPTDRSYTYGFRCAKDPLKEEDIPEEYRKKE